jgi:hypothetical protein
MPKLSVGIDGMRVREWRPHVPRCTGRAAEPSQSITDFGLTQPRRGRATVEGLNEHLLQLKLNLNSFPTPQVGAAQSDVSMCSRTLHTHQPPRPAPPAAPGTLLQRPS